MDAKLACGDYTNDSGVQSKTNTEKIKDEVSGKADDATNTKTEEQKDVIDECIGDDISHGMIDDNEIRLEERIANCKKIIDSLKLELTEEKSKLEQENKVEECKISQFTKSDYQPRITSRFHNIDTSSLNRFVKGNIIENTHSYSASLDSKLKCDEDVMEYEKQLQRYQNTLNMAQIEKKNVIRKQMLTKAYKLKLLEVENQCNIELLRVKQSLQCLEPLQMIVKKWKASDEPKYDLNSFELIPRYPELDSTSKSDINVNAEDDKNKVVTSE